MWSCWPWLSLWEKNIENEYFKCEKELRIKTEEVKKLKLEIRHLKQIVELRENPKDKDVDFSTNDDGIDTGYRRMTPQFESSPNRKNDKVGARNIKEVTK